MIVRYSRTALTLLLVVAGCATQTAEPAPAGGGAANGLIPAAVSRVVDGDTAWFVLDGDRREKVRFIGVDTPESTTRHEPFGKEASAYTGSILTEGRRVYLELDAGERDRYGRLLAYVWLDDPGRRDRDDVSSNMLNARLVAEGYANVLTVPPNVAYADVFLALQRDARAAGRGLWSLAS